MGREKRERERGRERETVEKKTRGNTVFVKLPCKTLQSFSNTLQVDKKDLQFRGRDSQQLK